MRAYLNQTVTMDAIRIIPLSWTGRACLRLEIYGCIKGISFNHILISILALFSLLSTSSLFIYTR